MLAPEEIVVEDRRRVAAFLEARLQEAIARPSRNVLHDLFIAISVGNRRAQRALSLVFEGTEDAGLKRSILRRYAILDRSVSQVESALEEMPALRFLDMTQSVIEAVDGGFQFAFTHIDDVRNGKPEVSDTVDTRPAQHRDPEGTATETWFSHHASENGAPTMRPAAVAAEPDTRRGH